jgi:hypothetical protein
VMSCAGSPHHQQVTRRSRDAHRRDLTLGEIRLQDEADRRPSPERHYIRFARTAFKPVGTARSHPARQLHRQPHTGIDARQEYRLPGFVEILVHRDPHALEPAVIVQQKNAAR